MYSGRLSYVKGENADADPLQQRYKLSLRYLILQRQLTNMKFLASLLTQQFQSSSHTQFSLPSPLALAEGPGSSPLR